MKRIIYFLFLLITINSYGQLKITGIVSEETLHGLVSLPGATVAIKGTNNGTITDVEGRYTIEANVSDSLIFSFIGKETQTICVSGKSIINVLLRDQSEAVEEVTVVAFGKQKKESVVGSISTIKAEDLKVGSSNLTTAIAGRLPGVISYQRSGEPGRDNAEFFVRGATTFGYKKDPLILIDGMEYTTTELARLTPDDIESFSIMKDATSNALYGARGANGVILVTTKGGAEGKAKVSVSVRGEYTLSGPTRDVELADPITYMKMWLFRKLPPSNPAYTTQVE
ncbi:TonB-dependent receptor plug domain-containing protein [Gaoshiqia sp. Z1-71]|uniref:TonB-dependent receptor plug domain-containing protein n=1 Tax=Gaoshiqia hydrogeniformans TaxID=3290090 RepID=UPI003BF7D43E